jgi:DNA-directed RNA polymerase specialized sigma24 family protein
VIKYKPTEVDLALSVMCATLNTLERTGLVPPGINFNTHEIADVCGCSPQTISKVVVRIKKKLRASPQLRQQYLES